MSVDRGTSCYNSSQSSDCQFSTPRRRKRIELIRKQFNLRECIPMSSLGLDGVANNAWCDKDNFGKRLKTWLVTLITLCLVTFASSPSLVLFWATVSVSNTFILDSEVTSELGALPTTIFSTAWQQYRQLEGAVQRCGLRLVSAMLKEKR